MSKRGENIEKIEKKEDIQEAGAHQGEELSAESNQQPPEPKETADLSTSTHKQPWYKRCWGWLGTHKKIAIPALIVLLFAIAAAIPYTRYLLAGTVVRQTFPVVVVDEGTGKPVSSATVSLAGKTATTDNEGKATIHTNVGHAMLKVSKKYYEDTTQQILVPIGKPAAPLTVELKATGRVVPVTVLNRISKKPAANVTVKAVDEDSEAKTDNDGKTALVVPADKQEVKAALSGDGFNNAEMTLQVVTDEVPANTFELTPSGKVYFLSNAGGNIDLIKTNLDGSERQTVLAGTGKEDRAHTAILASPDRKYIAFLSRRDGGEYPKLFLIETATDTLTTMDEGDATFVVRGWSDDRFIYKVDRAKRKDWEPGRVALKSYHAPTKKITTLMETAAEGDQYNYAYEYINAENVYILGKEIVFLKGWQGGCYMCTWIGRDKKATFNSVQADGSQKKEIKSYSDQHITGRRGGFGEIYILYREKNDTKDKVDKYQKGKIETTNQTYDEVYNMPSFSYLVAPSGNKTLWSEPRDGKNALFVGDADAKNAKEIGRADAFTAQGWFTDDYVLLTKDGSELFIMPADGIEGGVDKALKISDYYTGFYGYHH